MLMPQWARVGLGGYVLWNRHSFSAVPGTVSGRKLYFAFTASYSVPLISLTMEEHRLDPEAFWIHGCVFLALILETTH